MIANLILVILIKLVDQYTNTHSDNKNLLILITLFWLKKNENLNYLDKLVGQYININSGNKKLINTDYSVLIEKIETNPKALKFKVNNRVGII